jgi:hypothetical protein
MKRFSTLLAAVACLFLFSSCQSYGKEYKLDDKHNVYYKDGVDEATAKKLAHYLKDQQYFQDDINATVQVLKSKDTFVLNFVVDKAKLDASKETAFTLFGGYISQEVFSKAPVVINLTDSRLKPFKNLGYSKPADPNAVDSVDAK